MSNYRIGQAAAQDLIEIAEFGDVRFGMRQSDKHRDQFKKRFLLLAERPMLYPAVDHIRTGYRRSVCGVHSIYYRIDNDTVEIMRILGRQDPARNISDDDTLEKT